MRGPVMKTTDGLRASGLVQRMASARPRLADAHERAARVETLSLEHHALRLALLRLRELGRDDDQTEVDHEERANLSGRMQRNSKGMRRNYRKM